MELLQLINLINEIVANIQDHQESIIDNIHDHILDNSLLDTLNINNRKMFKVLFNATQESFAIIRKKLSDTSYASLDNKNIKMAKLREYLKMVKLLIEYLRKNPNTPERILLSTDKNGNTPLTNAIESENIDMVKMLLEYAKAHPDPDTLKNMLKKRDKYNDTPLTLAMRSPFTNDIAKLLLSATNDKDTEKEMFKEQSLIALKYGDVFHTKSLFIAASASTNQKELIETLIEKDDDNDTLLSYALKSREKGKMTFLLNYAKESPRILKKMLITPNKKGKTPLIDAIFNVKWFKSEKQVADLLNYAAKHTDPDTMKTMLSAKDGEGNTPLMYALSQSYYETVALLVNKSFQNNVFPALVSGIQKNPEEYRKLFINEDIISKYGDGVLENITPKLNETGWNRAKEIFGIMNGENKQLKEELVTKLLDLVNEARDKDKPPIKPSDFTHEQALNILRHMVYSSESKKITFLYDKIMPEEGRHLFTKINLSRHKFYRTYIKKDLFQKKLALVKDAFNKTNEKNKLDKGQSDNPGKNR